MPCTGAFADAYDFATFWCLAGLDTGVDDSGGAGNAFLTDSTSDFVSMGVKPEVPLDVQQSIKPPTEPEPEPEKAEEKPEPAED